MIDFPALGAALQQEMAFRGDTPQHLGQQWRVSPKTVINATKGRKLVTDLFMQVCIYLGQNPLAFWREGTTTDYSALSGGEGFE